MDFTAKFKDSGQVFDSTLSNELKNLSPHAIAKPFTFALGQDMFLFGRVINDQVLFFKCRIRVPGLIEEHVRDDSFTLGLYDNFKIAKDRGLTNSCAFHLVFDHIAFIGLKGCTDRDGADKDEKKDLSHNRLLL